MKRLRYSMSDEQWALIQEMAKAFSLDPKIVMQFATSIGLRFLDMSLIHPLVGLGKAIDERAEQGAAIVMSEFQKSVTQGTPDKKSDVTANVTRESKKLSGRKKVSRKSK